MRESSGFGSGQFVSRIWNVRFGQQRTLEALIAAALPLVHHILTIRAKYKPFPVSLRPVRSELIPLEVYPALHRRLRHRHYRHLRLGVCRPFRQLDLCRRPETLCRDHGTGQLIGIELAELLVG